MKNIYYDLKRIFRSFFTSCRNLIKWLPIIWQDRQFDHWYFYTIMEHKLDMMIQYYNKDVHKIGLPYVGMESDIRYMKIAKRLIKILKDDDYMMEVYDKHYKKWGDPKFEMKDIEGSEYSQMEFNMENVNTPEEREQERIESEIMYNIYTTKTQKAKKLLWKIFEEKLERWWD